MEVSNNIYIEPLASNNIERCDDDNDDVEMDDRQFIFLSMMGVVTEKLLLQLKIDFIVQWRLSKNWSVICFHKNKCHWISKVVFKPQVNVIPEGGIYHYSQTFPNFYRS